MYQTIASRKRKPNWGAAPFWNTLKRIADINEGEKWIDSASYGKIAWFFDQWGIETLGNSRRSEKSWKGSIWKVGMPKETRFGMQTRKIRSCQQDNARERWNS